VRRDPRAPADHRYRVGKERHPERPIDEVRGAGLVGAGGAIARRENLRRKREQRERFGGSEVREAGVTTALVASTSQQELKIDGQKSSGGNARCIDEKTSAANKLAIQHANQNASRT
jgi:hypothetical protein